MSTAYHRPTQARDALVKANSYRFAVAAERRKIAAMTRTDGARYLADLIETTEDPAIESAQIRRLLDALPRRGSRFVDETFTRLGIRTATKRLRELTPRQREELAGYIRRNV